jgi:hypothetical protein
VVFRVATALIASAPSHGGDVLYNGIILPDVWPPTRNAEEFQNREPQPVPYLKNPPAVIPIDVGRQLFVDDFLIESTTLKREFHLARMYSGNPLLKPERTPETEGRLPMAMPFSDGVWFDPKDQLFKMWYMAGLTKQTALATSRDGLHWDRPEFDVRPGTNVVQPDARDSSTVWLDLEEQDPQRRYKMWRSHGEDGRFGLSLHFSADGVHWGPRALRTGSNGDRSTVFWNPFRKVWVYSLRHGWGQPRARRYWEVKNLLAGPHWSAITEPPMWLVSDKLDPPRDDLKITPQLYNLDAVAYESLMVGLFTIWRGDQNIPPGRPKPNSIFLGFSRDGYHFDRPDRRPFVAVSETRGDWNWGNVQSSGGCFLVVGDELWFYVSGRAGGVNEQVRDGTAAAGLAILRRDGFASMNSDSAGGELITRPLTFGGQHLFINADATDGEVRAEFLDAAGKAIPPFTADNCEPFRRNSTSAELRWKGADDLSALPKGPIRARFIVKNGALYSFWISKDTRGASNGYVAAGGPGFNQPVDTVGVVLRQK